MLQTAKLPEVDNIEKAVNYNIPLLALVKAAQQQHGLRDGNYQRYRQYISRKLRRMRKSLHFQQGTRSKVVPKKLSADMITDPRFIVVKVFEIERSWAYAMQLKEEANTELRKRFQMISRLRKAVLRANQLSELMNELSTLDAQTKLELQAYIQWIYGILSFELHDWIKAKEFLESTQTIYTGLIETVEESDSRGIYTTRMDDIRPQIHYCAYNIGDKSAAGDLQRMRAAADSGGFAEMLQIDQLLSQARASQTGQVQEIQWLGVTIPVKLETAKMAILTVKESDQELAKTDDRTTQLSLYESALKACVEALSAVRDELRSLSSSEGASVAAAGGVGDKKTVTASSEKISRLQLLYNYLQYLKLSKTVERTLLHIAEALSPVNLESSGQVKDGLATGLYTKPQELSRLYDTMVQTLQEIQAIPGVIQDCMGLTELLQAKMLAYRAYRCYYLALTYIQGKRFAECCALLTRARRHAEQAIQALCPTTASWTASESEATPCPEPDRLIHVLTGLVTQIEAEDLTCRAAYMLDLSEAEGSGASVGKDGSSVEVHKEHGDKSKPGDKALCDRLDQFLDVKTVQHSLVNQQHPFVSLPPRFEPVPVKPIFFDLALNHVTFPSLADRVNDTTGASGSGLAGLVKGWIWRGAKPGGN